MTNELTAAPEAQTEVGQLLSRAIDAKLDVAALEKLVALHERASDRLAEREFYRALAEFQAECPSVHKTSKAEIVTTSGARYGYTYAELDEIARTVGPHLHKLGLSYTWDMEEENGRVKCICWLRHENGHKISATFVAPVDTAAKMSGPQRQASALTYAKRQALIAVLGLTTCDEDADGANPPGTTERISEQQALVLDDLLTAINASPEARAKFCRAFAITHLDELPASRFEAAKKALEGKRKP